ncbi:MAG: EpsI family protein [Pirellulales bacterium]|nr:EpsI family protein [Pirellulales bacterium]
MVRTTITVAVVVGIGIGSQVLLVASGSKKAVAPPEHTLSSLPLEIGSWRGEEVPIADERREEAIGADETINRRYRNASGDSISLHAACFVKFDRSVPHSPDVCYPGNGYTKITDKTVELPCSEGAPGRAKLVAFEMNGRRVYVLFWFQLGDQICLGIDDMAAARRELRPRSTEWPSILKFLLETPIDDLEADEARLVEFATRLHEKSRNLQGTSYLKPAASTTPSDASNGGVPD